MMIPDIEAERICYRQELSRLIDVAVQMAIRHGIHENVVEAIAEGHRRGEIDDDALKCRFDWLYSAIFELCDDADRAGPEQEKT